MPPVELRPSGLPNRRWRLPARYRDEPPPPPPIILPEEREDSEDLFLGNSQQSREDNDQESIPPFVTKSNTYGVFRSYPCGRPSYTPNELFTLNALSDSPNFTPDAQSTQARPWWSSLGLSLSVIHFSHPFLGTCKVHQFLDLGYLEGTPFQGGI